MYTRGRGIAPQCPLGTIGYIQTTKVESMNFIKLRTLTRVATATAIACSAFAAHATTQVFTTASADPSASVTFATASQQIGITLTNTLATPIVSAGQELTGVEFNVLGLPSITGSVSFVSGDLISIQGGVLTNLADTTAAGAAAWNLSFTGGHMLLSSLAGGVGKNGPDDGIIPFAATYPGLNASLKSASHNPLYRGPVTFALTGVNGVTADSFIASNSVAFHFNTDGLTVVGGGCTSRPCEPVITTVPEPETYAMLLAGIGGVFFMARRRRVE